MRFRETPSPDPSLFDRGGGIEAGEAQTELRSLRDALWEAVNGIEEKASGAPVERELVILESVADAFDRLICELGRGGTQKAE